MAISSYPNNKCGWLAPRGVASDGRACSSGRRDFIAHSAYAEEQVLSVTWVTSDGQSPPRVATVETSPLHSSWPCAWHLSVIAWLRQLFPSARRVRGECELRGF